MVQALSGGVSATGVNWSGIASNLGNVGKFLGGIGSLFGHTGGTSVKDSAKLMAFQEALQEKYLKNYYTNARQSLESAGYNPMLAYMNSISGGQTNATAQYGNDVGQRAQGIANLINYAVAGSQIENTNANTTKQLAEAQTEAERPELIRQQAIGQTLTNILTKGDIDWQEREKMAEIYLKYATGSSQQINANVSREALDIGKDKEARYKEWGEKYPWLRNLDETVNRYINLNFGGTAGSAVSHVYKH